MILGVQSAAAGGASLTVEDPWVREGPPVARTLAGYMILSNASNEPVSVDAVRSTDFDRIELHRSSVADGMAKMKMEVRVEIPASGRVAFEPGGRHLMLIGPTKTFTSGDLIRFVLILSNGEEIPVTAAVRRESLE